MSICFSEIFVDFRKIYENISICAFLKPRKMLLHLFSKRIVV